MAILLSILASAVTLLACVMAWRARRAAQRLALEMIHLRDRLVRAETHYKTDAARGRAAPAQGGAADESLAPRLLALEEQLRVTLEHSAEAVFPAAAEAVFPATAEAGTDRAELRTRILKHLRHRGYEHVRFLEDSKNPAMEGAAMEGASEGLLVEAERGGVTAKGRVDLLPDGSLQMRAESTVRAFP